MLLPVLLLGTLGVVFLTTEVRRRLMAVLPFPVVYLGLIFSMNMVGEHTLQPVLPALAAVLGVGASAWLPHISDLRPGARRYAAALLAGAPLAVLSGLYGGEDGLALLRMGLGAFAAGAVAILAVSLIVSGALYVRLSSRASA